MAQNCLMHNFQVYYPIVMKCLGQLKTKVMSHMSYSSRLRFCKL